jgi:predicted cobalt transporter CbtA
MILIRTNRTCLRAGCHIYLNSIKDKLPVTIVSLRIIVYPAILGVNLPDRFKISGEVHLQVRFKPSVT